MTWHWYHLKVKNPEKFESALTKTISFLHSMDWYTNHKTLTQHSKQIFQVTSSHPLSEYFFNNLFLGKPRFVLFTSSYVAVYIR